MNLSTKHVRTELPTHVHSCAQLEQQPHPLGSGLPTAALVHWPLPGLDWGPWAGAAGQGAVRHLSHRLLLQALEGQYFSHPKNTQPSLLNLFLVPAPSWKIITINVNLCFWPTYLINWEYPTMASLLKMWNCSGDCFWSVCMCVPWQVDLLCGCWVDSNVNVGEESLLSLPDLMVIGCSGSPSPAESRWTLML